MCKERVKSVMVCEKHVRREEEDCRGGKNAQMATKHTRTMTTSNTCVIALLSDNMQELLESG